MDCAAQACLGGPGEPDAGLHQVSADGGACWQSRTGHSRGGHHHGQPHHCDRPVSAHAGLCPLGKFYQSTTNVTPKYFRILCCPCMAMLRCIELHFALSLIMQACVLHAMNLQCLGAVKPCARVTACSNCLSRCVMSSRSDMLGKACLLLLKVQSAIVVQI